MTLLAVILFASGFAVSWAAGRFLTRGASIAQGAAIGACGVGAFVFGMPDFWQENILYVLVILLIYGLIGAVIFRAGVAGREGVK
ncbi:MAG: hypothetical protein EP307_03605 [Rhodobacteraceae bacterium]|nr:MAG: hypothetical protein EP307_03605 [Paracoccaceae bacterium]